jgi:hypothetical protein
MKRQVKEAVVDCSVAKHGYCPSLYLIIKAKEILVGPFLLPLICLEITNLPPVSEKTIPLLRSCLSVEPRGPGPISNEVRLQPMV